MPQRLLDREPVVSVDRLLAYLVPPPRFDAVRFSTYRPDPNQPSQTAALAALEVFAFRLQAPEPRRFRFFAAAPPEHRPGIYLDGGYGVGKTHLLASLWHASPVRAAFGTFVEYTNLVGALGFASAVDALAQFGLVCIDEFELDDPGDTVLMSSLLARLVERGVKLAATSNTLPDRLGEGRFAAEDFLREIQGLSARFDVLRIDGDDFRHRGMPEPPTPLTPDELTAAVAADDTATLDTFADVLALLRHVHPSRYGALVDGVGTVFISDVCTLSDQSAALRLVVLADRLYDRDVPVVTSGVPLDQLFASELRTGGYRKKYKRAISRLTALAREGAGETERGLG